MKSNQTGFCLSDEKQIMPSTGVGFLNSQHNQSNCILQHNNRTWILIEFSGSVDGWVYKKGNCFDFLDPFLGFYIYLFWARFIWCRSSIARELFWKSNISNQQNFATIKTTNLQYRQSQLDLWPTVQTQKTQLKNISCCQLILSAPNRHHIPSGLQIPSINLHL